MPLPPLLTLTADQRACLQLARDYHPKPYFRERAAALLKLNEGVPVEEVARCGLLRPRHYNTLYRWAHWYRSEGLAGLRNRPGRGRKPAFSPSDAGRSPSDAAPPGPV